MENENYEQRPSSIGLRIFLFIFLVGAIFYFGSNIFPETVTGSINVRVSHYWPPLGNVNCFHDEDGNCVETVANGDLWRDWVGKGAACPMSWEFGTRFKLSDGRIFTCVDRGEMVQYDNGIPWVDLLEENASYDYGEIVTVEILK